MSTLFRVRISSFLAGVAVAGSVAVVWLRDDVRRSFDVMHTHVRPKLPPMNAFLAPELCGIVSSTVALHLFSLARA